VLLLELPSLSLGDEILRLLVAAGLGGAVGLEREYREREAGFRTHMLVAVGAALFTIASAYGFHDFLVSGDAVVRTDPTRIAAQIVTGIGFLGAGAIIRQGVAVRGLTTAATLWVVAAIGLTTGAGYYSAAIITTLIALISLWPLRAASHVVMGRFRAESGRILAQLPATETPAPLVAEVERLGARLTSLEVSYEGDRRTVLMAVALPAGVEAPDVIARLADVDQVLEIRWTD
jgi:putative Mg2+ transporter-C (MgtC) family protein